MSYASRMPNGFNYSYSFINSTVNTGKLWDFYVKLKLHEIIQLRVLAALWLTTQLVHTTKRYAVHHNANGFCYRGFPSKVKFLQDHSSSSFLSEQAFEGSQYVRYTVVVALLILQCSLKTHCTVSFSFSVASTISQQFLTNTVL